MQNIVYASSAVRGPVINADFVAYSHGGRKVSYAFFAVAVAFNVIGVAAYVFLRRDPMDWGIGLILLALFLAASLPLIWFGLVHYAAHDRIVFSLNLNRVEFISARTFGNNMAVYQKQDCKIVLCNIKTEGSGSVLGKCIIVMHKDNDLMIIGQGRKGSSMQAGLDEVNRLNLGVQVCSLDHKCVLCSSWPNCSIDNKF